MKHYPHHIGDFDKATRHLTRIERSVYRDLIDLYYDTEQRLTLDLPALCRRIIARSNEESTAVEQVLNEFFTETPTGWYHDRCEAEISAYHANTSQKALAGKASAEARRLKKERALNGEATAVEQPLNTVEAEDQRNSTNQSTNQPSTSNTSPDGDGDETGVSPPADANGVQTSRQTADNCPHQQIIDLYHQALPTGRQVREWTPARQAALRSRWRENPKRQTLEWWGRYFAYCAKSKFLTGQTHSQGRRPFELSLDWLVKPENMAKVIEGAYHEAETEVA